MLPLHVPDLLVDLYGFLQALGHLLLLVAKLGEEDLGREGFAT